MKNPPVTKNNRVIIKGFEDYAIETFSTVIVALFALVCLLPFIYVFFVSFMSYDEYIAYPMRVIPRSPTIKAYQDIWGYNLIHTGYRVTLFITIIGTILSVMLLVISAYPLSKSALKGRNFVMGMILFTMFFNGGMIPDYLLVRTLHINNTVWALILPGCISAFYLILMKNFIQTSIPPSLEEAAKVDGANEITILFRVIVPLLKPVIATMIIFNTVNYWNNYFSAMLYISDRKLWPLILVLRELVVENTEVVNPVTAMMFAEQRTHPFTLRMAAIIVVILPILFVYPFMQRHFVKGISLGSIKE
ncbi:MAG: carbohydrate ABC transporter permease [Treponema sp.]|nr:carbohydrate ABC transporter permease [Treponema sp.]